MKAPEAATWWSDTGPVGVVAVVAVEAGPEVAPVAFTVAAVVDDDPGGAPVVAVEPIADDDVVDAPAVGSPAPAFTPAAFLSCEQAAGTARASTTPNTGKIRRLIEGHPRPAD
jgi:hypothetical protein